MATYTVTVEDEALTVGMRTRVAGTEAEWVQAIVTAAFADFAEQAWAERQSEIADLYDAADPAIRTQVDTLLRGGRP